MEPGMEQVFEVDCAARPVMFLHSLDELATREIKASPNHTQTHSFGHPPG